jgi:hypothetical protein
MVFIAPQTRLLRVRVHQRGSGSYDKHAGPYKDLSRWNFGESRTTKYCIRLRRSDLSTLDDFSLENAQYRLALACDT